MFSGLDPFIVFKNFFSGKISLGGLNKNFREKFPGKFRLLSGGLFFGCEVFLQRQKTPADSLQSIPPQFQPAWFPG